MSEQQRKKWHGEKKGARREGEEEEEAECIFLFLSVTHEQMYTGLLTFVHIDINSFFFFLLSSNRQRKE